MVSMQRRAIRMLAIAGAGAMFWLLPATAQAKTIKVPATGSTTSIQEGINAASPGDTVSVASGTYKGPTISVTKNNLTITGSAAAVIDASGNEYGITVGSTLEFEEGPTCPAFTVSNFKIKGLTVENAEETGIFLFAVDGFQVVSGKYLNNGEYGIFPRCSQNGLIAKNSGGGGDDATIYVGVDHNVTVEGNNLTNGELGIELESTNDSIVRNNKLSENTTGIFVIVLPGLPKGTTERALIEGNTVSKNNRPNPFPPFCGGPAG